MSSTTVPSPAPRATSERLLAPPDDETLVQHVVRSTKNFFTSCFGCIQTSDEKAKIRYYQYLIESRKKAFGVEYVNLLKAKAPQAELDACVEKCLKDIGRIDEDIAELNAEVEKVTGETKSKIVTKPPPKVPATAPTATATSAGATASAPAPAAASTAPHPTAPADVAPPPAPAATTAAEPAPAEAPAPSPADTPTPSS
jgi:hypothetical protein